MFKKRYVSQQSFLRRYQHIIVPVVLSGFSLFLFGALCSYHANDASFFFYQSSYTPAKNLFGLIGAHAASILLYLFGGFASFCVVGFLIFCSMLSIFKVPYKSEWDRITAWIILIVCVTSYASYRHIDLHPELTPGGYIGILFYGMFHYLFESGASLAIACLTLASLIVLLRFLIAPLVSCCKWTVQLISDRQRFWVPLFTAVRSVYALVSKAITKTFGYFYYVLAGILVEKNQETLFEFDYQTDEDIHFSHLKKSCAIDLQTGAAATTDLPMNATSEFQQSTAQATDAVVSKKEEAHQEIKAPYQLPNLSIFVGVASEQDDRELIKELEARAHKLEEKLERFGVCGKVTAIKRGPVVTVFEYQPDIDAKLSKIVALEDDLALALQALSIRIIAPIPGRSVVGFEVANTKRKNVHFSSVIRSKSYQKSTASLPLVLGEDTSGAHVVVDLARMPHLLVAGSTGSGKSVALNGMLISLLCKYAPEDLKLILIDPKRLEFAPYADIPHLLFPIVTESKKVAPILRYVIQQMEMRYELMAQVGARNIFDYHTLLQTKSSMPFMVIVIDEFADLMITAGREIEDLITRIAQMARAAGIHMLLATQRPSVDVITGLIKVNFPSRISFRVTSKIDSRTILDTAGADKLLGKGDMLFLDSNSSSLQRVHGAYVSDQEINQIVGHIKSQAAPAYVQLNMDDFSEGMDLSSTDDQLYKEVIAFLETIDEISISLLQRKFRIGYNRSARIIEMLESQGFICPSSGGKTRKVMR